jgi:hypothetical protein
MTEVDNGGQVVHVVTLPIENVPGSHMSHFPLDPKKPALQVHEAMPVPPWMTELEFPGHFAHTVEFVLE